MNFKGQYKSSTFTDVMLGKDHKRFQNAFSPKQPKHAEADRIWVREVMTLGAGVMGVTYAQFVQAFKTGRPEALLSSMRKVDVLLQKELGNLQKMCADKGIAHDEPTVKTLRERIMKHPCFGAQGMTEVYLNDSVRKAMEFGLGARHKSDRMITKGESENLQTTAEATANMNKGRQQQKAKDNKAKRLSSDEKILKMARTAVARA